MTTMREHGDNRVGITSDGVGGTAHGLNLHGSGKSNVLHGVCRLSLNLGALLDVEDVNHLMLPVW
jgi:hypothetical protein